MNSANLGDFSLQKVQKFTAAKCVADFETPGLLNLISRKNWVTEKFCNFYTL